MGWEVMAERCDQCLFGPNAIVSAARRRELLVGCRRDDRTFECHKATILGRKVTCRGFYDQPESALPPTAKMARRFETISPESVVEFVKL